MRSKPFSLEGRSICTTGNKYEDIFLYGLATSVVRPVEMESLVYLIDR